MISSRNRIAVLGAGTSGIAAARLAVASGAVWVGVFDSGDPDRLGDAARVLKSEGIECHFGEEALRVPGDLDLVVVSPGIDVTWPIGKAFSETGVPMVGEIEYAFQQCPCPVVGITGTNGKTTTTELTATILKAGGLRTIAGGNYGHAFSEILLSDEEYDIITLEISSFQLETIDTFRPRVAVWMNFAADHLDRYASLEDYRAAKLRIFENQQPEDAAVIKVPGEDVGELVASTLTFSGFGARADFQLDDGWITLKGKPCVDFGSAKLHGRHNAENVMASLGIALSLGLDLESDAIQDAIRHYDPPRHRCEPVGDWDGRTFINDSKATNLHALTSSLRGQEAPVVLIVGGKNKGLDYGEMIPFLPETVSHAVCLGEMAEPIRRSWEGIVSCESATDMEGAVRLAAEASKPGQVVLFSPGTSSFDMYSGYAERGDAFRDAVLQLNQARA